MVIVLLVVSVCAFVIIQLPPGDYITDYIIALELQGTDVDEAEAEALRRQYGLDRAVYLQYLRLFLPHGGFQAREFAILPKYL